MAGDILVAMNKRCVGLVFVVTVLAVLAGAVAACENFDQWSSTKPSEERTEVQAPPTAIKTDDRAILAVYENLLSQAKNSEAKVYLADFYATCDKWSAKSELFKDGTSVWHVILDMTDIEAWYERPYWQQASWFVLDDGKVIPSNRFQANALRIEADLQELSVPSQP